MKRSYYRYVEGLKLKYCTTQKRYGYDTYNDDRRRQLVVRKSSIRLGTQQLTGLRDEYSTGTLTARLQNCSMEIISNWTPLIVYIYGRPTQCMSQILQSVSVNLGLQYPSLVVYRSPKHRNHSTSNRPTATVGYLAATV